MGGRSSKVVITPEAQATTSTQPEGTITQLKEVGENVNGDSIPPIDGNASANEQNGDCSTANTTAATLPAVDEPKESKSTHKKSNPIIWMQKKISFKKAKASKAAVHEEKPDEAAKSDQPAPEPVQEKPEEHTGDAEAQSEEISTVDHGTTIPEPAAESSNEPLVEITPSLNGLQENIGEEQFLGEPETFMEGEKENIASISEKSEEESKTDVSVAEKLANLGIDSAQSLQSNNVDVHVNGDTAVEES
ncbi:unnamed protein product [Hydatigera taeniaeformis]|uniref:A-kinase anchor protein 12-like n=1 Tax=Hydatigena taeniaeformis TaxID=6205 RepID=A0A0R3WLX3_HYDTA|nr:unnamed protein product [Hydatigera taeniaeformis]